MAVCTTSTCSDFSCRRFSTRPVQQAGLVDKIRNSSCKLAQGTYRTHMRGTQTSAADRLGRSTDQHLDPGSAHSPGQVDQAILHPPDGPCKGATIDGSYEVLDVLQHTGSISVCTARGPMGKHVLVKTLFQQKMSSWRELENFESESKILQRLRRVQLGTPFIHESLEDNGVLHQIQELAEGPTLAEKLAQGWKATPDEIEALASQLLSVLQAMEQAAGGPIAHGTISPDCIHIDASQGPIHACLTGFSEAEQLLEGSEAGSLTTAAQFSHHEQYAAPETLKGEPRLSCSDGYSVGAVLAAAATGKAPHFGSDGAWMCPPELADTKVGHVIKGLMRKEWESRLTASNAQDILRGIANMEQDERPKQSSDKLVSDAGPQNCNLKLHGSSHEQPVTAVPALLADILCGLRLPATALAISFTAFAGCILMLYSFFAVVGSPPSHWPLLGCVLLAPAGLEWFDGICKQAQKWVDEGSEDTPDGVRPSQKLPDWCNWMLSVLILALFAAVLKAYS